MSTSLTRRKLVAGAAWAAPVVAASATIPSYAASVAATNDCILAASPAYSISGTDEGAKTVQSFAVPNNVHKLRFELVGGAGGTNNRMTPAGSGAKVSGIVPVTPGSIVQIIAAAGGIGDGSLTPTAGGEGYGNGGSVPAYTIPATITAQVDAKYPNPANSKTQAYAASGGGSSALLIDGVVVAVAGGGGGAGMTTSGVSYADPWYSNFNGQIDAGVAPLGSDASPQFDAAGSASAAAGSNGTSGYEIYNAERSKVLTYNSGFGGAAGVGGAGGAAGTLPASGPIIGFETTNNQVLFSQFVAGNTGTSGFAGNGGDGAGAYSYQLDENPASVHEKGTYEDRSWDLDVYNDEGAYAQNFNGYQSVVSGGGGAGYGGGGSGAAQSVSSIVLTQKWLNSPTGVRQGIGYTMQGGAGGAGGSYIAPSVTDGSIVSAENAPQWMRERGNGSVTVTFCEAAA